jgi:hypothetical protein
MVRTLGTKTNFHVDYSAEVGHRGLTLITPIDHFPVEEENEHGQFQLLYKEESPSEPATDLAKLSRYTYQMGRAVVFGAGFNHTSEPGAAESVDKPHAYLCFCFGTDQQEHWPGIAKTLDGYQAKWLAQSNGTFVLSRLGKQVEDEAAGIKNSATLSFDSGLSG